MAARQVGDGGGGEGEARSSERHARFAEERDDRLELEDFDSPPMSAHGKDIDEGVVMIENGHPNSYSSTDQQPDVFQHFADAEKELEAQRGHRAFTAPG